MAEQYLSQSLRYKIVDYISLLLLSVISKAQCRGSHVENSFD
jgi:hypothetical protein